MKKIMFNEPFGLQQATFEGTKTMTRRIVPQVILDYVPKYQQEYYEQTLSTISFEDAILNMVGAEKMFQRYVYNVGEVVAIAQRYSQIISAITPRFAPHTKDWMRSEKGWDNKMFVKAEQMPHHIKITDRKLERLQDISDEDCLREGIYKHNPMPEALGMDRYKFIGYAYDATNDKFHKRKWFSTPREAFAALIDKLSGKGTWKSNPLVFAYEYKRIN